jgi:hypothetical protein
VDAGCPVIYNVGAADCTTVGHFFHGINGAAMTESQDTLQLSEEDIEFLVAMLRSASGLMTTDELVEALRSRPR